MAQDHVNSRDVSAAATSARPEGSRDAAEAALTLSQRYPVVCYLLAMFVWSIAWWTAVGRLSERLEEAQQPLSTDAAKFLSILAAVGNMGPALTGMMCVMISEGEHGFERVGSMLFRRVPWKSYPLLLLPVAMHALLYVYWQYDEHAVMQLSKLWTSKQQLALQRGWGIAITTAIAEVVGWQGFLLPHLLRQFPAHRAALLSGLVWAVWHALPTLLGIAQFGPRYLVGAPVPIASLALVPVATVHTYAYIQSRGSLLLSMLLTVSFVWAALVFEGPLQDASDSKRIFFASVAVLLFNVLALPPYMLLQTQGIKDARRGTVRDVASAAAPSSRADADSPATPATAVHGDDEPHLAHHVDSNELRRRKAQRRTA